MLVVTENGTDTCFSVYDMNPREVGVDGKGAEAPCDHDAVSATGL